MSDYFSAYRAEYKCLGVLCCSKADCTRVMAPAVAAKQKEAIFCPACEAVGSSKVLMVHTDCDVRMEVVRPSLRGTPLAIYLPAIQSFIGANATDAAPPRAGQHRVVSRELALAGVLPSTVPAGHVRVIITGTHKHQMPPSSHVPELQHRALLLAKQQEQQALQPPASGVIVRQGQPPRTQASIAREVQKSASPASKVQRASAARRILASGAKVTEVSLVQSWQHARGDQFRSLHYIDVGGKSRSDSSVSAGVGESLISFDLLDTFADGRQPKVLSVDTTHNVVQVAGVGSAKMHVTTFVFRDPISTRSLLLHVALHFSLDSEAYNMVFGDFLGHIRRHLSVDELGKLDFVYDMSNALRDGLAVARARETGLLDQLLRDNNVADLARCSVEDLIRRAPNVWRAILVALAEHSRPCLFHFKNALLIALGVANATDEAGVELRGRAHGHVDQLWSNAAGDPHTIAERLVEFQNWLLQESAASSADGEVVLRARGFVQFIFHNDAGFWAASTANTLAVLATVRGAVAGQIVPDTVYTSNGNESIHDVIKNHCGMRTPCSLSHALRVLDSIQTDHAAVAAGAATYGTGSGRGARGRGRGTKRRSDVNINNMLRPPLTDREAVRVLQSAAPTSAPQRRAINATATATPREMPALKAPQALGWPNDDDIAVELQHLRDIANDAARGKALLDLIDDSHLKQQLAADDAGLSRANTAAVILCTPSLPPGILASTLLGTYTLVTRVGAELQSWATHKMLRERLLMYVMWNVQQELRALGQNQNHWFALRKRLARQAPLLVLAAAVANDEDGAYFGDLSSRVCANSGTRVHVQWLVESLLACLCATTNWRTNIFTSILGESEGSVELEDGKWEFGLPKELLHRRERPEFWLFSALRGSPTPLWDGSRRGTREYDEFEQWSATDSDIESTKSGLRWCRVVLYRRASAVHAVFVKKSKRGKLGKGTVSTGRDAKPSSDDAMLAGVAVEFCVDSDSPLIVGAGATARSLAPGAYITAPTSPHAHNNQPADVRQIGTPAQWRGDALRRGTTLPGAGKWFCGDVLLAVYVRADLMQKVASVAASATVALGGDGAGDGEHTHADESGGVRVDGEVDADESGGDGEHVRARHVGGEADVHAAAVLAERAMDDARMPALRVVSAADAHARSLFGLGDGEAVDEHATVDEYGLLVDKDTHRDKRARADDDADEQDWSNWWTLNNTGDEVVGRAVDNGTGARAVVDVVDVDEVTVSGRAGRVQTRSSSTAATAAADSRKRAHRSDDDEDAPAAAAAAAAAVGQGGLFLFATFDNVRARCYLSVACQLLLAGADASGHAMPRNFVEKLSRWATSPFAAKPVRFPDELMDLPKTTSKDPSLQQDPTEALRLAHGRHSWWTRATRFLLSQDTDTTCHNDECPMAKLRCVRSTRQELVGVITAYPKGEGERRSYGADVVELVNSNSANDHAPGNYKCDECNQFATRVDQWAKVRNLLIQPVAGGDSLPAEAEPELLYISVSRNLTTVPVSKNDDPSSFKDTRVGGNFAVNPAIRFGRRRYRLIGVSVHAGQARSGHYVCVVERNVRVKERVERQWLAYDDVGARIFKLDGVDGAIKFVAKRGHVVTVLLYAREGASEVAAEELLAGHCN